MNQKAAELSLTGRSMPFKLRSRLARWRQWTDAQATLGTLFPSVPSPSRQSTHPRGASLRLG